MALVLRPNSEDSQEDYDVLHGELRIGRIYKRKISLQRETQWLWALNGVPETVEGLALTGVNASLEEATAALGVRWASWLAWARLKEED
jgi:hypothetical protein